jgi:F0F1-type ATP synthase epsilon subunit
MSHQTTSQKLNVTARAPFHVYYEGPANLVSATNAVGKFDILPGHADFFSIINPGEVVIETDSDVVNFVITNGIMSVRDDEVMLFVNI